jgi:hypothetical protein
MLRGAPAANDTHPWGLFWQDASPVLEAVDPVGPGQLVKKRNLSLNPADLANAIGRQQGGERYIYGGMMKLHYGHYITDTLSRLWQFASERPKPEDRIVFQSYCGAGAWFKRPFIRDTLSALGISQSNALVWHRPASVPNFILPQRSFVEQHSVYRAFGELCSRIGRSVLGAAPIVRNHVPVYLSKAALKIGVGQIKNEAIIEAILSAEGVEIVYPEKLEFVDQVRLFSERSQIFGCVGSALHTSVFAQPGGKITIVCPTSRPNSNFRLMDLASGHRPTYLFAPGSKLSQGTDDKFQTCVEMAEPERIAKDLLRLARSAES